MNPFDGPPSSPPVSVDPPDTPSSHRRKAAVAVVAAAGLVGATAVGVNALSSSDDTRETAVTDDADVDDVADVDGDDGEERRRGRAVFDRDALAGLSELDEESLRGFLQCIGLPDFDEFDSERLPFPFPFDFDEFDSDEFDFRFDSDELDDLLGEFDFEEMFGEFDFEEMFGEFDFDDLLGEFDFEEMFGGFDFEEMFGELFERPDPRAFHRPAPERRSHHERTTSPVGLDGIFGDGGLVTVVGPNGLTLIDLGDGDGSVTVTRDGETGEIAIATDGTAAERELGELLGALPFELPFDLEQIESCLADLD